MLARVHARPHFLLIHLFSGRRRPGDIHDHLNAWAEMCNVQLTILSADTAVSVEYGNLHIESASWKKIERCFADGLVAGAVAGSPCETYSAARHQQPPAVNGIRPRWPRPLRSARRPHGLAGLSAREYRQLRQGTSFFLQTALMIAYQIMSGGLFVSEHPAMPSNEDYASIWRTSLLRVLRRLPNVTLHRLQQWRWGSSAVKPTGLLTVGLPQFYATMERHTVAGSKPQTSHVGKREDGQFKTAEHKEYPSAFSKGIANALGQQMLLNYQQQRCREVLPDVQLKEWIREAAASASMFGTSSFLPDYQGKWWLVSVQQQFLPPLLIRELQVWSEAQTSCPCKWANELRGASAERSTGPPPGHGFPHQK